MLRKLYFDTSQSAVSKTDDFDLLSLPTKRRFIVAGANLWWL